MYRKHFIKIIFILLILAVNSRIYAIENPYFTIPPFIKQDIYSNLYLVLDYSGSMRSPVYYPDSYNPNKIYSGYYLSTSSYECVNDTAYQQNYYTYVYCDTYWKKSNCNPNYSDCFPGNYLNWANTKRIELLKMVLTGGPVIQYNGEQFVESELGQWIKYSDAASYNPETEQVEGILQKIYRSSSFPRLGLVIYSSYVKINIHPTYDYDLIVRAVNYNSAGGMTATRNGIEVAKDYYETTDAYEFEINGTDFIVPCAKNFILLMSDGAWNYYNGYACDYSYCDPVWPINDMWDGGDADIMDTLNGKQGVMTFSVAMFLNNSSSGYTAMQHFGVFGGYDDADGNGLPCNYSSVPVTSRTVSFPDSGCSEWDSDGDNLPDAFFKGETPEELKQAIEDVFNVILKKTTSGTSVAILSDKRKEGSVMSQAVFYPSYEDIPWIGKLFGYWFLNFKNANNEIVQNIREDTTQDFYLNICNNDGTVGGDHILDFDYDDENANLLITHTPSNCLGYPDNNSAPLTYDKIEDINSLFELSNKLNEDFSNSDIIDSRIIYVNGGDDFDTLANVYYKIVYNRIDNSTLAKYFGNIDNVTCLSSYEDLVKYVIGIDIPGCQQRVDKENNKRLLGDIIYSSPVAVDYDNVSMIYVAANDGMLHAIRLGKAQDVGGHVAVKLQNDLEDNETDRIGTEEWAFIPKNALPYLRYRVEEGFTHLYIHDLTPYVFEYAGHKILIGGMRMGGGVGCVGDKCINPPADTCSDPTDATTCIGLSSYYALDITDPFNPVFLWEYKDPDLGFTTSGPAVYKENGNLYVIFLNGPSNYRGESGYDKNHAGVHILKLDTSDFSIISKNIIRLSDSSFSLTGGGNSGNVDGYFGNRLFTQGIDYNYDGETDALFFAINYTQANSSAGPDWVSNLYMMKINNGNVDIEGVMANLSGVVTSKIMFMPCFNYYYIYFGTGRWYYKTDDLGYDEITGTVDGQINKLYGVNVHDCLLNNRCTYNGAVNNTDSCTELQEWVDNNTGGVVAWEMGLNTAEQDNNGNWYGKERNISDPASMEWANTVVFSTMEPNANPCSYGGRSRMWGLNCAVGTSVYDNSCDGFVVDTSKITCGYLQTSTAAVYDICATSYSGQDTDRSRVSNGFGSQSGNLDVNGVLNGQTAWVTGVTPETPPIIPIPYSGRKGKILLWIEK